MTDTQVPKVDEVCEEPKPFWHSKTFWVNVLAAIGLLVQTQTGFVFDLEAQGAILIVINIILRSITGAGLSLK